MLFLLYWIQEEKFHLWACQSSCKYQATSVTGIKANVPSKSHQNMKHFQTQTWDDLLSRNPSWAIFGVLSYFIYISPRRTLTNTFLYTYQHTSISSLSRISLFDIRNINTLNSRYYCCRQDKNRTKLNAHIVKMQIFYATLFSVPKSMTYWWFH